MITINEVKEIKGQFEEDDVSGQFSGWLRENRCQLHFIGTWSTPTGKSQNRERLWDSSCTIKIQDEKALEKEIEKVKDVFCQQLKFMKKLEEDLELSFVHNNEICEAYLNLDLGWDFTYGAETPFGGRASKYSVASSADITNFEEIKSSYEGARKKFLATLN